MAVHSTPINMKLSEIRSNSKKTASDNSAGRKNLFGHYVWNPVSSLFVWLLLPTKLSPNNISFLSMICAVVGFVVMCFARSIGMKIAGVAGFMLWAILDCVDGNIARIRKQFSPIGDLWDAAAGYVAMSLMFLGIGICAFDRADVNSLVYVILGGVTSICILLPRLLMHFRYHGEVNEINDQRTYGFVRIVAFNITSPDGLVLPLMIVAILLHMEHLYIAGYFLLYLIICVYTCAKLLKE